MKRTAIILISIAAVLIGLIWHALPRPPKEAAMIGNFREHRTSFELLRDMLPADPQIHRLANWGVQTDKSMAKPPEGDFPLPRFNKYIALMKEVGADGLSRDDGDSTILLWASGFGGDTMHVGICSLDQAPTRQVASFAQFYRDHKAPPGNDWIYQHIEGNWYLCTDLWSDSHLPTAITNAEWRP